MREVRRKEENKTTDADRAPRRCHTAAAPLRVKVQCALPCFAHAACRGRVCGVGDGHARSQKLSAAAAPVVGPTAVVRTVRHEWRCKPLHRFTVCATKPHVWGHVGEPEPTGSSRGGGQRQCDTRLWRCFGHSPERSPPEDLRRRSLMACSDTRTVSGSCRPRSTSLKLDMAARWPVRMLLFQTATGRVGFRPETSAGSGVGCFDAHCSESRAVCGEQAVTSTQCVNRFCRKMCFDVM